MCNYLARSHWAFLVSLMHSRWKLTSIRRCSGGITEPSANNRNSWYSWGSISQCPKFSILALKFFANHWRCFVGRRARRIFGDDQRLIAEYSPNNHRTFADIFNLRCIGEPRRSICEVSAIIRGYFIALQRSGILLLSLLIYVQRTSQR